MLNSSHVVADRARTRNVPGACHFEYVGLELHVFGLPAEHCHDDASVVAPVRLHPALLATLSNWRSFSSAFQYNIATAEIALLIGGLARGPLSE
jgi:hypothetical protein